MAQNVQLHGGPPVQPVAANGQNMAVLAQRVQNLTQLAGALQQMVNQQAANTQATQAELETVKGAYEQSKQEREATDLKIQDLMTKAERLRQDARVLRMMGGGTAGLAGGLVLGVATGAKGLTLVALGVGGAGLGIGGGYIYDKLVEDK